MYLDLDVNGLVEELKKFDAKKILVQIPEGVKVKINEYIDKLENLGYTIYLSVEPTWGACDIGDYMAQGVNADMIVHIGHSKFTNSEYRVIYWPCFYVLEEDEELDLINKINDFFKDKKIAIVGTVQYNKIVKKVENSVSVKVLETESTNLNNVKAQILGCNISTIQKILKEADAILYIGDGYFHPGAILFEKDVDLYTIVPGYDIKKIERDPKFLQKRILLKELAKGAKKYGIFVSFKKGQNRIIMAEKIKKYLESFGKIAHILVCDSISYDKVIGMGYDCLVNTACPRIAYDDYKNYPVPIISVTEALNLFDDKSLEIDRMN